MEPLSDGRAFIWGKSILTVLAEGAYVLARFAKPTEGGHIWQDWAYRLMVVCGARRVQGPGVHHLFYNASASGLSHELDSACMLDVPVVVEAKDEETSPDKTQVDAFDGKTFDYFEAIVQRDAGFALHRMMWCTQSVLPKIHTYAARKGIILAGPDRIPLPVLLAATERWDANEWLPESLLAEFVLLGERACRPLGAKASLSGAIFSFQLWSAQNCEDLNYLHQLASDRLLDWLDRTEPLRFERRAAVVLRDISARSELRQMVGWRECTT